MKPALVNSHLICGCGEVFIHTMWYPTPDQVTAQHPCQPAERWSEFELTLMWTVQGAKGNELGNSCPAEPAVELSSAWETWPTDSRKNSFS